MCFVVALQLLIYSLTFLNSTYLNKVHRSCKLMIVEVKAIRLLFVKTDFLQILKICSFQKES